MQLRYFTFGVVAAVAVTACGVAAVPAQERRNGLTPDVIYYNARVVTVDDNFSYAQAVAITAHDRRLLPPW